MFSPLQEMLNTFVLLIVVNFSPLIGAAPFKANYIYNHPAAEETCHLMAEINKKMVRFLSSWISRAVDSDPQIIVHYHFQPLVVRSLYAPHCEESNKVDCWIMETLIVQYSTQRLTKMRQMVLERHRIKITAFTPFQNNHWFVQPPFSIFSWVA